MTRLARERIRENRRRQERLRCLALLARLQWKMRKAKGTASFMKELDLLWANIESGNRPRTRPRRRSNS